MKKSLLLPFLFFTLLSLAQKDKSLFWEISGNGLSKKSYLYGTMHVNDKVSYHLSDAFFKHLLEADMVGNESDPETWNDVVELLANNEINSASAFYSDFYLFPLKKDAIGPIFTSNNYFNSMLSGIEGDQADFQENTVLDMFIFQTGKKYKKKIVGLESATESILTIMKIDPEEAKPKEENKLLLIKLLKNKSFNDVLKEYYREKDVVMLDSIYKLMFSKKAHDALIVNRNEIMAKSIDSLAKTGSLFSAVGAAHLAGKKGIIQLLRAKGYTVNPIVDTFTEAGKNKKKSIEEFFPNPGFALADGSDGMVKAPLNKKLIISSENIGSPDFTNGGVINLKRIPLNYFLKEDAVFDPKILDSLFFENIAGNIIEKKYLEAENFTGYDIKNVTKTGNNQHYRFYVTPLELISISMTGTGNYVRQYEKEIFDNIKIKSFGPSWEKITPKKGGFSVEVPVFNTVYGNHPEKVRNIEIQAYDNASKSYYFLTERTLNDTYSLEDSAYEQKEIHHEFLMQHDADTLQTKYDKAKGSFESESQIGNKKISLKSYINGGKYYLLGAVNAPQKDREKFFNSFASRPFQYASALKTYTDTIANFKVDLPAAQNKRLFLNLDADKDSDKNAFLSKSKFYTFSSESGQTVSLDYYKYHKYESAASMDSITAGFMKDFLKSAAIDDAYDDEDEYDDYYNTASLLHEDMYEKTGFSGSKWFDLMKAKPEPYVLLSQSESFDKEKNIHTINALVSRPNATQAIKYKVLFQEDSYYLLKTLVEKNYKNDDPFVEKTFASLTPTKRNTATVFEDKLSSFIADAKSGKDTIRYSAMNSFFQLNIRKDDFATLKNFMNTFQFKSSETQAEKNLLMEIGKLKDPGVIPFLEAYYKKSDAKTEVQIGILQAISSQKSKAAYKKILELMEYDLPLSDNEYDISGLFYYFEDDLENSAVIFPDIFQFYSTSEYSKPILRYCNLLLDKKLISVKKIASFKKTITSNAKSEYKRMVSWKQKNSEKETAGYEEEDTAPTDDFMQYLNLLGHFPKDKETAQLFERAASLSINDLDIEILRLSTLNGSWSDAEIQKAIDNPKTRYAAIQLLIHENKKALLKHLSDEDIARSAVYNFEDLTEKDSITLLEKRTVPYKGKSISYYFYQISSENKETETTDKVFYPIAFINENGAINPLAYKVFYREMEVDQDKLAAKYSSIINQSLSEAHYRATFEKQQSDFSAFPDYTND